MLPTMPTLQSSDDCLRRPWRPDRALRRWCLLGIVFAAACPLLGATWYVDNRSGDDANDGLSLEKPLATIARALQGARTSDTISLAKTGLVYREPIPLTRLGGTPAQPLTIEGNGATISGLRPLPPERWTKAGERYEIAGPKPYGFPYLVIDGRREPPAADPEKLPPGGWSWTADAQDRGRGVLRFRPAEGRTLADHQLEATLETSGLCVASASYLVVRNLISECHSNDGFNIHGDCRGIYCENIEARGNGDDGFSIHEAIEAVVRNGHFHHNGSGIEDVNLSRSLYSGLRVHDNGRLGVLFIGAFHSAVDAVVYGNPRNFSLASSETRHLIGGPLSPLSETSVYLQNVIAWGGDFGVQAAGKCRVMIVNSVFSGSKTGIDIRQDARLHLTKSVVACCADAELCADGREFFGDYNVYFPGRFRVGANQFLPPQWEEFRKAVGHHEHSLLQDPKLTGAHALGPQSPRAIGNETIGPTADCFGAQPATPGAAAQAIAP
ncbi:MAG: right-handed parallel beta-helix repeat-containing protein [Candidatus Anammoximicrobium sp.]|nr:right-handed parallel beta-helix repeat-containing protein [Candidatus Anammoximicrobium sp.]